MAQRSPTTDPDSEADASHAHRREATARARIVREAPASLRATLFVTSLAVYAVGIPIVLAVRAVEGISVRARNFRHG